MCSNKDTDVPSDVICGSNYEVAVLWTKVEIKLLPAAGGCGGWWQSMKQNQHHWNNEANHLTMLRSALHLHGGSRQEMHDRNCLWLTHEGCEVFPAGTPGWDLKALAGRCQEWCDIVGRRNTLYCLSYTLSHPRWHVITTEEVLWQLLHISSHDWRYFNANTQVALELMSLELCRTGHTSRGMTAVTREDTKVAWCRFTRADTSPVYVQLHS